METYWNAGHVEVLEDDSNRNIEGCSTINSSLNSAHRCTHWDPIPVLQYDLV